MNLIYLVLFGAGCSSCCSSGCGNGRNGCGCSSCCGNTRSGCGYSNNCGCGNSRSGCSNNCGCGISRSGCGCSDNCGCNNGFTAPASAQSNYSACCCRSSGCSGFGSRSGVCTDWEYYARQYALCNCCCNN